MRNQRPAATVTIVLVVVIFGMTCGGYGLLMKRAFAAEGAHLWSLKKPVKSVVSTLLSEVVLLGGLALLIAVRYFTLPLTWLLLPLLLLMQILAMIGLSFALSAVGAYFRDIKDVVQVFNVVGIYFLPAIYMPGLTPRGFDFLLLLNPFSHLVYCFQDALYFGAIRHPYSWIALFVLSLVSFVSGHRLCKRLSTMFGNVL